MTAGRARRLGLARTGIAALVALASCSAAESGPPPFRLDRAIALPDVHGRIDHLAIDLARDRLFVAELGNGSVDVVDLARGAAVKRIGGLSEPQGIAYLAGADLLAVASGGDGSLHLYRGADLAPAGTVALGSDVDNVRADPRGGRFLVGYGDGALAAVDAATRRIVARVALPAHPEAFEIAGDRVLVNLPDAGAILAVDLAAGRVTARWPATHRANFAMALDAASGTAAIAYRSPRRLVTLDTRSGAVRGDVETCGDADDVFIDTRRQRTIVVCGSGEIDLVGASPGPDRRTGRTPTAPGARTGLYVPESQTLFVAVPASGGRSAEIRAYRFAE